MMNFVRWALTNTDSARLLHRFGRILATGTTGLQVLGTICKELDTEEDIAAQIRKVVLVDSGPEGGDIQIAHEVVNGRCQVVIFFQDPRAPHPHDGDINLLRRACQLPEAHTVLLSDRKSAKHWVESLGSGTGPPIGAIEQLRLSSAKLRTNAGALKEVLVPPSQVTKSYEAQYRDLLEAQECDHGWFDNEDAWATHKNIWASLTDELLRTLVPYFDAYLEGLDEADRVVSVTYGSVIESFRDRLKKFLEEAKPGRTLANVKVQPACGWAGQHQPNADELAKSIASIYSGTAQVLNAPLFPSADHREVLLEMPKVVVSSITPLPGLNIERLRWVNS